MTFFSENLEFQILNAMKTTHKEGTFQVSARPYAALSYRLCGNGIFTVAGQVLRSCPGDLLYLPAGISYEVSYSVTEMIVVHLRECNADEPFSLPLAAPQQAERLLCDTVTAWETHQNVYRIKSKLYALLDLITAVEDTDDPRSVFSRCKAYMDARLGDTALSVESVCQSCFVSRSTLQRAFLQRMGISPGQYLLRTRLDHAFRLLSHGLLPIKEVAGQCGFADEKYFSCAFKRVYGFSPSILKSQKSKASKP